MPERIPSSKTHLHLARVQLSRRKPLHGYGTQDFSLVKIAVNAEAWSVRGAVPRFDPWGGRCHTIILHVRELAAFVL